MHQSKKMAVGIIETWYQSMPLTINRPGMRSFHLLYFRVAAGHQDAIFPDSNSFGFRLVRVQRDYMCVFQYQIGRGGL
jgi:hypothetical protein